MNIPAPNAVALYRNMLRIRKVQLRIEALYHYDEMKTPIHLCIGQEAVAVGICDVLARTDYISSNHRGHGHYLAKGGDLNALIAELYCRDTGCSRGRGGSMHLLDTSVGHMGSSSIVGGGIPIATGLALAAAMENSGKVSVVFFGDGAADEGVLYESVNFAILKKLPIVFVYENNRFSVCSRVEDRYVGEIIFHRAPFDQLAPAAVDGNDVLAVREAALKAVNRARAGEGPSFLECRTYRIRGHAGAGNDSALGYRTAEEITAWEARCPILQLRASLHCTGLLPDSEVEVMERRIDAEIDDAFRFAQESPLPAGETLNHYVFSG